ncbi:hypothetical protein TRFO_21713 [Tritrichomonas foetus]|uniref:C2H2-type domain-containing protein n=1 Tax=Tritrichomonas foetus TaxID=1144522 RepID=A0A1J4KI87_9EUKA|nr:hypothetical protein TRFO_21713 [Tritrichomonas foetus]|eukprot:OHT09390.1 hypothetical protein TRFO_21713 [Tritrichomonas foetus]
MWQPGYGQPPYQQQQYQYGQQAPYGQIPVQQPPMNSIPTEVIDWEAVSSIDPDLIRRTGDLTQLQPFISKFAGANLNAYDSQILPHPLSVRLCAILQVSLQYMSDVQKSLQNIIEEKDRKIARQQEDYKKLKASYIKADTILRKKMRPSERCPICLKQYLNYDFLDKHVERRHPEHLEEWLSIRNKKPARKESEKLIDQLFERIEALQKTIHKDRESKKHHHHHKKENEKPKNLQKELYEKQQELMATVDIEEEISMNKNEDIRNQLVSAVDELNSSWIAWKKNPSPRKASNNQNNKNKKQSHQKITKEEEVLNNMYFPNNDNFGSDEIEGSFHLKDNLSDVLPSGQQNNLMDNNVNNNNNPFQFAMLQDSNVPIPPKAQEKETANDISKKKKKKTKDHTPILPDDLENIPAQPIIPQSYNPQNENQYHESQSESESIDVKPDYQNIPEVNEKSNNKRKRKRHSKQQILPPVKKGLSEDTIQLLNKARKFVVQKFQPQYDESTVNHVMQRVQKKAKLLENQIPNVQNHEDAAERLKVSLGEKLNEYNNVMRKVMVKIQNEAPVKHCTIFDSMLSENSTTSLDQTIKSNDINNQPIQNEEIKQQPINQSVIEEPANEKYENSQLNLSMSKTQSEPQLIHTSSPISSKHHNQSNVSMTSYNRYSQEYEYYSDEDDAFVKNESKIINNKAPILQGRPNKNRVSRKYCKSAGHEISEKIPEIINQLNQEKPTKPEENEISAIEAASPKKENEISAIDVASPRKDNDEPKPANQSHMFDSNDSLCLPPKNPPKNSKISHYQDSYYDYDEFEDENENIALSYTKPKKQLKHIVQQNLYVRAKNEFTSSTEIFSAEPTPMKSYSQIKSSVMQSSPEPNELQIHNSPHVSISSQISQISKSPENSNMQTPQKASPSTPPHNFSSNAPSAPPSMKAPPPEYEYYSDEEEEPNYITKKQNNIQKPVHQKGSMASEASRQGNVNKPVKPAIQIKDDEYEYYSNDEKTSEQGSVTSAEITYFVPGNNNDTNQSFNQANFESSFSKTKDSTFDKSNELNNKIKLLPTPQSESEGEEEENMGETQNQNDEYSDEEFESDARNENIDKKDISHHSDASMQSSSSKQSAHMALDVFDHPRSIQTTSTISSNSTSKQSIPTKPLPDINASYQPQNLPQKADQQLQPQTNKDNLKPNEEGSYLSQLQRVDPGTRAQPKEQQQQRLLTNITNINTNKGQNESSKQNQSVLKASAASSLLSSSQTGSSFISKQRNLLASKYGAPPSRPEQKRSPTIIPMPNMEDEANDDDDEGYYDDENFEEDEYENDELPTKANVIDLFKQPSSNKSSQLQSSNLRGNSKGYSIMKAQKTFAGSSSAPIEDDEFNYNRGPPTTNDNYEDDEFNFDYQQAPSGFDESSDQEPYFKSASGFGDTNFEDASDGPPALSNKRNGDSVISNDDWNL